MNVVAQAFAGAAALVHVLAFYWETVAFRRPTVHRDIFHIPGEDLPAVRLWAFNQGFYNLFLAAGTILGLVMLRTGDAAAGRALVLYTCAFMVLAGVVLAVSDRMALGRAKGSGLGGALGQLAAPLVVLIAGLPS
ncbi:putative membrane protein [Prauserella shujinwangii]|uniref:Putative membrane protein n=1 Tax=Prauserella shujinwangii TaxID=1453103 RepID=A0A2T0LWI9_9PSEU|nr:DUF1304 domain-containing protein [Prauserella shujinwangii]PRX48367.1 putative membrane protein [Prauserella shujinwangii]